MSRMLKASSFAAFTAAVVLVLGSAGIASAAEDKKADDKKAEAAKTGTLSGTVTGADGKPAKDVTVRLYASRARGERGNQAAQAVRRGGEVLVAADKPAEGEKPAGDRPRGSRRGGERQAPVKETKSNDKGEFTFADVPAGEYSVSVTEGNNAARGRATVKAGETAKVTLALKAREAGRGDRGNRGAGDGAAKKAEGAEK